jgi:uncharacterized protein YecT (DUF1311 family)
MMRLLLAPVLGLSVFAGVASAQSGAASDRFEQFLADPARIEARYSPEFRTCMRLTGGVTAAMRDCAAQEGARLDRSLERALAAALARLGDERRRAALRDDQQAWAGFRQAHCSAEMNQTGMGTAALIVGDSCHLQQTIRRTLWLETQRR